MPSVPRPGIQCRALLLFGRLRALRGAILGRTASRCAATHFGAVRDPGEGEMSTTSRTRKCLAVLGSIAPVAALSSCGTDRGTARPAEIDVRTLDIGPYPVDPTDIHLDHPPGLLHG